MWKTAAEGSLLKRYPCFDRHPVKIIACSQIAVLAWADKGTVIDAGYGFR